LLDALDGRICNRAVRLQALSLLSSFVRQQPTGLQSVLETRLVQNLQTCLLLDNSSTVVDLALTSLLMFIPHITSILIQEHPRLFMIFARILCWDQYQRHNGTHTPGELSGSEYGYSSEPEIKTTLDLGDWDVLDAPIEGDHSAPPKANYLFTFLYGLFPLNFMGFIRRPRRYLKMKGYPHTEGLQLFPIHIKTRTESLRTQHKLHPHFFTTTPEDELKPAENEWLKNEPADLVTKCLGLCITVVLNSDPGPPPSARLPPLPKKIRKRPSRAIIISEDEDPMPLLSSPVDFRPGSSNRNTLSTTLTASSTNHSFDVKIPARQLSGLSLADYSPSTRNVSPNRRNTDDMPDSPTEVGYQKGYESTQASPTLSTVGPAQPKQLQSFAQVLSRFPIPDTPNGESFSTFEIMLLKNDLNLERFQKQKYMEQLSQLQKRLVTDPSIDTDAQSLMNKNKGLMLKLSLAEATQEQLKKEITTSRSASKKFEEQLTSKLKALREEERGLKAEVATLRNDLQISHEQIEELKRITLATEQREVDSKNQLSTLELDLEELAILRSEIDSMTARIHEYELRESNLERTQEEHGILKNEFETARLKLASSDAELERTRRQYEQRIFALESAARSAQQSAASSIPSSFQQMIDSALAQSHNKVLQLKKSNASLQHKVLDLELRCQELEGNGPRPGSVLSLTRFADDSSVSTGLSPTTSARESIVGMPMSPVQRAKSSRKAHDFAPAAPLIEEEYASNLSSTSLPSSTNTIGGGHLPMYATAPTTASHSLTPSPNATAPSSHYGSVPMDGDHIEHESATHDFQIGPAVTDSLASSRMGNTAASLEASIKATQTRVYGRGGAGNVKKNKDEDKKKPSKTGGFRLKGIM
jgi:hypothetical protein